MNITPSLSAPTPSIGDAMTAIETPRKSLWIPWVFVGAMLVVIAVNGVLVTYALKSFSGLAVDKPYERGVQYNQVLAVKAHQDALGWKVETQVRGHVLEIHLTGRDGAPMDRVTVSGELERPLGKLAPVALSFTAVGNGRYVAKLDDVPQHGQWDVNATLLNGDERYLLVERVFVP
jgi:nitrogen fixation protein FixH